MRRPALLFALCALGGCTPSDDQVRDKVAAAHAERAVEPPGHLAGVDLKGELRAVGTEPFWAMDITPATLRFSGADLPERSAPNPGFRLRGAAASWTARTAADEPLSVVVAQGNCSDGMSDRVYPLSALVTVGDKRYVGCAAATAALQAPPA